MDKLPFMSKYLWHILRRAFPAARLRVRDIEDSLLREHFLGEVEGLLDSGVVPVADESLDG